MNQHWRIITGDSRASLAAMPDCSVHCAVTSPPYWGLRDYGVDGQMGLEKSPAEFVAGMVGVFREVRRVLRGDGTCWVNIGDSYCNTDKWGGGGPNAGKQTIADDGSVPSWNVRAKREPFGLKPKDLCGVPWRLALALQDDGWYLRQDIIWAKPNPMPESVTDRCTKAHEYIFLLAKSPRYFYDADALREPHTSDKYGVNTGQWEDTENVKHGDDPRFQTRPGTRPPTYFGHTLGRNARSVWTIATQPSSVPHYAMFPEELPRRCIKAATSEHGCCPKCAAPWERLVERTLAEVKSPASKYGHGAGRNDGNRSQLVGAGQKTLGWQPTCECNAGTPVPCVVLDPFSGMATTGKVALELGRSYVGIELNPKYAADSRNRLREVSPLLAIEDATLYQTAPVAEEGEL